MCLIDRSKGLGKNIPNKWKQAGVAILISNKIDFKLKSIKRDNEGHFILVTGKILQEEISILNIYATNTRAPSYIKETLLKLKTYIKPYILTMEDFNTSLPALDRSVRNKMNREIRELTDAVIQVNLSDIYRIFHPNTKNIPCSQHLMEPSQQLTTYSVTKQPSTNPKIWINPMCLIK